MWGGVSCRDGARQQCGSGLMRFCLPRGVRYQLSNRVSILAPALACVCALVLGPPPPPRQAASGCNADRLPVCARGNVRAEVRVRVRLGSEGFVRRRQGVRRSWPSERYMCAQRRSSLEQKSWVKVLVIRPGAGCRVPGAGCRVPGAGCRQGVEARGEGRRRRGVPMQQALRPNPNPNANP